MKPIKALLILPRSMDHTAEDVLLDRTPDYVRSIARKVLMDDERSLGSAVRYVNGKKYIFWFDDCFLDGYFELIGDYDAVAESAECHPNGNPEEFILGKLIVTGPEGRDGYPRSLTDAELTDFAYYLDSGDGLIVYRIYPPSRSAVNHAKTRGGIALPTSPGRGKGERS